MHHKTRQEREICCRHTALEMFYLGRVLWVVEFLVTMQESVTASLGRLKTGEHHPLDAGVDEFHRVLAEVATIR